MFKVKGGLSEKSSRFSILYEKQCMKYGGNSSLDEFDVNVTSGSTL